MLDCLYYYCAEVVGVYDGDTCTVDIDLGLRFWAKSIFIRLARINAPEIRGEQREAGLKARDFLRSMILNKSVIIKTNVNEREKYGRYLAEIWIEQEGKWINVNDLMVENLFAQYYKE